MYDRNVFTLHTINIIIYFCFSICASKTQWTHPRTGCKKVIPKELPFGWSKTVDEEGKIIYVQKETGSKTYVDPRLAFSKEDKKHVHDFRQRFDGSSTAYQVCIHKCCTVLLIHCYY